MPSPIDIVDFHVHSSVSDGTDTPEELIVEARTAGLAAMALCDHDTLDGLDSFRTAAEKRGVDGIPAVEVSTDLDGRRLHIVALGVGIESAGPLQEFLDDVRRQRHRRNRDMLERLGQIGIELTMGEITAVAGGEIIARPHFARAMVKKGYVGTLQEAFDRYISNDAPGNVPKVKPPVEEAIAAVKSSGALAIIAHPNTLAAAHINEVPPRLDRLLELGIDGVEAYHPDISADLCGMLTGWARRRGRLVSGGSDYHGSNKNKKVSRLGRGAGGRKILARDVWGLVERLAEMRFTGLSEST